ncbi:alpha/beta hydrolase [Siccirubricoccus sp. KC 17139]|uniref:Alpha/beta hydrolase n=1 Tax=Siccirubricoccus soli TaxID=2899147 RepID=A0ABT1D4R3_9PROT|nr:alpha/beta hydrolase [Siccirubricoccus soli]MCO6416918.1 alpha/beta hydrolase [Siccirubricoccus soli]MCP2683053.1 alpha/beta hydrolase [Siccirubricoccus soli]
MSGEESGVLHREGVALAWRRLRGRGPGVVFLPGFNSDMQGGKATELAAWCAATGRAFLRFDYSGHGESGGRFEAGSIGTWLADAAAVIAAQSEGPQVLVGSSMGGWMALLLAARQLVPVAGLIGIAAAPDFVTRIEAALPEAARAEMAATGMWRRPSAYGDPYPITRHLLEEGRNHLLLGGPIPIGAPVRLLHGQEDPDVPWQLSLEVAAKLATPDVQVILVKDGDHRLSRPEDLALLRRTLAALLGEDRL